MLSTGNELQAESPFYGGLGSLQELEELKENRYLAHNMYRGGTGNPNVMMEAEDMLEEREEILEGLPLQQPHQYGLRPWYEEPHDTSYHGLSPY